MGVIGVIMIFQGLLVLLLPETKDKEIPDTIEEAQQLHAKRRDQS